MPLSVESEPKTKPHPLDASVFDGGLYKNEYFWRNHQPWLAESGYMLRPRYRLDWEPSWIKSKKNPFFCEDGRSLLINTIMHAVRISDGRIVALKQVSKSRYPDEEELNRFLTMSEPQASDRHNHSIPVDEILQSPLDENVLVMAMPYLIRINKVKFATIGEAVECFRQLFEGLQFLHRHHIAHWARTRTSYPPRYYYIDFGLSWRLPPEDPSPRIIVSPPGDKTIPEFIDPGPRDRHDPYKVDVYCLGNLIPEHFMAKSHNFEFLQPVLAEMVRDDPAQRPSIDLVFQHFERLRASLSRRTLRSRVVYEDELWLGKLYRGCRHAIRTAFWVATGTPALPTPRD